MRYEFTKPIIHASLLERDIEVSQWGGNLATEERYWLANHGASLANHFSRVAYAQTAYYSPPTVALRALNIPLRVGSLNPYFTDDIGNVSTSRFRSNLREANLEIKPRYPVFGGWKYSFRIGWDADLKHFLRKLSVGGGSEYVLKVPFLEGPKMPEGVGYERVQVRVLLPEGATYVSSIPIRRLSPTEHTLLPSLLLPSFSPIPNAKRTEKHRTESTDLAHRNVKFSTPMPLISSSVSLHRTFMDTLGRTTLTLTALNVIDDSRDTELIVRLPFFL